MLNLPVGTSVILSEFTCAECSNSFWVEKEPTDSLDCPRQFCNGIAYANGDIKVYPKKYVDEA